MNLAPSNAIKLEWGHFLYPHHLACLPPPSFWNFWILLLSLRYEKMSHLRL